MVERLLVLALVCVALGGVTGRAGALPDPYRRSEEPWIGPAPVPVMEQVFWVQLVVPPGSLARVEAPEGVTLLDQTKAGQGREVTRLYFRSDRGVEDGQITIDLADGRRVSVPLQVLTYRQDIERWIKEVPGIDPSVRKRGRSYYTDELIALAKSNMEQFPKLREGVEAGTQYDRLTDAELFAALPSWNVPRQCYSNWPSPIAGEEIYKRSAFYPWIVRSSTPWKAQCPVSEQLFPSNDWANDDLTSGDHPDDGWGWDPGTGERSDRAGWIAYYNHRVLWEGMGGHLRRLGLKYLLLGDEEAARRAAVLLCRMAYVYPGMNMRWQQVKPKYLRPGRLLVDGNWERNVILIPACRTYDAIFEYLDRDERLVEFLQAKDPSIRSPQDIKALIDTYLIQVFGWDWIRRELSGGNMGAREEDLAQFAVCADMGEMSDRWIEELFTHAYNSGSNKGGVDDETFINTTTREGVVMISALGYAYDYLRSKSDTAEILSRVTSPRWKARCNLYDPQLYPKFRAEFGTWADFVVAGQFGPGYGDSGGPAGSRYLQGIPAQLRREYERAYRRWPTDRIARAIHKAGQREPSLFEQDVWPQVEAQVTKAGPEPPLESRVMDGVGFVFLESRAQAEEINDRAGIAFRYGYGRGHHHHDNLNIEVFAKGLSVAPELGYPCWAHPMGDTTHVTHHNTGMIDRSNQYKSTISHGTLELFAGAPEASFADISAQPNGFPNRVFRRAVCLADAPGGNVYLVDILRLAGGTTRTFCFHGPPYDDFQSNLTFAAPADGAAARRGLARNIVEVQTATADGDAWADWKYKEKDVRLRVGLLGRAGRRYVAGKCAKPDIPELRYLFAEEEAEDGATEFIAVWQPYEGEPFVEQVERLPVEGASEGEFSPVAVRVTLAGGRIDTFLYTFRPEAPLRCGELEFQGSFGYWSEQDGKLRAAHLANGAYLRRGEEGIPEMPPAFRAKIAAADYREQTVKLDRKLPEGELEGRLIYIQGGEHRTAYHIAEVLPPGDTARLDPNAIIYRSRMVSIGEDRQHLVAEIPPPLEATRGFEPGYYNGAALTGEDGKAHYRVTKVEGDRIHLDRAADEADFPDVDGDGRRMIAIYDMGPGDEVAIYSSVFKRF